MFLAEKGIEIELEEVDIGKAKNREPAFLAINPMGTLPVLELDDGTHLAESLVICEYFEDLQPKPPLFGRTAQERANTRMWERRMELELMYPLLGAFRNSTPFFKGRITQIPEIVEPFRAAAAKRFAWLDQELGGRDFIAGNEFTAADITLFCTVEFGKAVGEKYDSSLTNLVRWNESVSARPSAAA
jgi:glutathione S-transferase